MKKDSFDSVLRGIPKFVAIFRVTKVPAWAPELQLGDELFFETNPMIYGLKLVSNNAGYNIGPSYLEFVEYRKVN